MALVLGWKPGDKRSSYYWRDPSVDWDATPEDARTAYMKDGDGSHLVLKNGTSEAPTRIVFRALDAEERAAIVDRCNHLVARDEGETATDYVERAEREGGISWRKMLLWAFAVGCDIEGTPLKKKLGPNGLYHYPMKTVKDKTGQIVEWGLDSIIVSYTDDIYVFYGRLVWDASRLTEDEKKALP